jgi:hypothetical protein
MGCGQKKLYASVAVPPAPVRVPSQWPLVLMSHLSANEKMMTERLEQRT